MDTSFKPHHADQKLILLLREGLNGSKTQNYTNHLNYVLKKFKNNRAQLYLIGNQYKIITQIVDIKQVQNMECFRWINRLKNDYFVCVSKSDIIAYRAERKQDKYQKMQIFCSSMLILQKNVEMSYLSQCFELQSSINMIGYTNTDEFYLIHLSFQNIGKYSFDIIQLKDSDNPSSSSSFFSFLSLKKTNKQHFSSIKIQLLNKQNHINDNHSYFLCARDSNVSLIQIKIDKELQKSSFKTIDKYVLNLSSVKKYKIKQILSYKDDRRMSNYDITDNYFRKIIMIYESQQDNKIMFRFCTIDKEMKLKLSSFQFYMRYSLEFKTFICHDNLYISTAKQTNPNQTICHRLLLHNIQEQFMQFLQIEPYFIRHHKIDFVGNATQLYLITPTSVQLIESNQLLIGQGASQQEIQYLINKKNNNIHYNQKIKYNFERGNIDQIVNLLYSKIAKIQQSRQHHKKYYKAIEKEVNLQFIQDIIAHNIIKFILQIKIQKNHINQFYSSKFNNKTSKIQSQGGDYMNLLKKALQNANNVNIGSIIYFIAQQKTSIQFVKIINYTIQMIQSFIIQQPQLNVQIQKLGQIMFKQSFIKIIQLLRKQIITKQYEIIIQKSLSFVKLQQKIIINDIKKLAKQQKTNFLANIIMKYNLNQSFIQIFDQENINFAQQYIKQFVQKIQDRDLIEKFVEGLFKKCKEVYFKNQNGKKLILKKIPELIKGLSQKTQHFQEILKKYFPNLAPLFYLRSNNNLRIKNKRQIAQIGQKKLNPQHSKMLFLSVLQKNDEQTEKLIHLAEFCKQNNLHYMNQRQLFDDLLEQNCQSVNIGSISKQSIKILQKSKLFDKNLLQNVSKNVSQYQKKQQKKIQKYKKNLEEKRSLQNKKKQ